MLLIIDWLVMALLVGAVITFCWASFLYARSFTSFTTLALLDLFVVSNMSLVSINGTSFVLSRASMIISLHLFARSQTYHKYLLVRKDELSFGFLIVESEALERKGICCCVRHVCLSWNLVYWCFTNCFGTWIRAS